MKKKKKIKSLNLEDFLFDTYNDIIEINNRNNVILNNIKQIKQQLDTSLFVHYGIEDTYNNNNIDFMYDFINIDYVYFKFTKNDKIICSNISKYSNVDKNILIPNFNNKKNIHKQLDYFIIKYENFTKKFCKINDENNNEEYNIGNRGILNYTDLFMLIKDSNCVPFWNDKCEELSKQIFMPTDTNVKISKTPNTFNYSNWFETEHKTSLNKSSSNNKKLEIDNKENLLKNIKIKKQVKWKILLNLIKLKFILIQSKEILLKEFLVFIGIFIIELFNTLIILIKKLIKLFI